MVIILLAVDWRFGLASLVGIILAFVAEFIGFGSGEMKENMGKYQKALEEMNNASVEYVRGMSVVKAFKDVYKRQLLARLWDVKSGSVAIRGVDTRQVPLAELMDHISMVFQRVYLFQDTIYNNISMGKPNATEEEVYDCLLYTS